jgi:uncharacterized protein YukE
MPNLQVDIEFLQQAVAAIDRAVSFMEQNHQASQSTFILAELDWQGHFRQSFDEEYTQFRQQLDQAVSAGQELSQRIRQAIARFEQIDSSTSVYSG